MIPRIALWALNPLPCQAWPGYGVSNAHHGEVRGCRRVYERTLLRGRRRCAAGGRHIIATTLLLYSGLSDSTTSFINYSDIH
jgi:hypothetical protein